MSWFGDNITRNPFLNPTYYGAKAIKEGKGIGTGLLTSMTPGMAWEAWRKDKKEQSNLAEQQILAQMEAERKKALQKAYNDGLSENEAQKEANKAIGFEQENAPKSNTGLIIGGSVLGIAVLSTLAYFIFRTKRN